MFTDGKGYLNFDGRSCIVLIFCSISQFDHGPWPRMISGCRGAYALESCIVRLLEPDVFPCGPSTFLFRLLTKRFDKLSLSGSALGILTKCCVHVRFKRGTNQGTPYLISSIKYRGRDTGYPAPPARIRT